MNRPAQAAGGIAALLGLLAVRGCLYHATPPSDAAITTVVRDVVMRERLADERTNGTLESQSAAAVQIPAMREARVEVLSVHRPWFTMFSTHSNTFYVRARMSWGDQEKEGCFPVETSVVAPAVVYSSVAMDLCG